MRIISTSVLARHMGLGGLVSPGNASPRHRSANKSITGFLPLSRPAGEGWGKGDREVAARVRESTARSGRDGGGRGTWGVGENNGNHHNNEQLSRN